MWVKSSAPRSVASRSLLEHLHQLLTFTFSTRCTWLYPRSRAALSWWMSWMSLRFKAPHCSVKGVPHSLWCSAAIWVLWLLLYLPCVKTIYWYIYPQWRSYCFRLVDEFDLLPVLVIVISIITFKWSVYCHLACLWYYGLGKTREEGCTCIYSYATTASRCAQTFS